ncbi:MAG: DNA repair protein RadC [Anaerolineae bacterium]|nr:DNA repair protein RadC [Anaerolineae bacterium]
MYVYPLPLAPDTSVREQVQTTFLATPHISPYHPLRLRDLPLRERPVYRLHRVGPPALSATELIAAIIGGDQQLVIAQTLLARYDSLTDLAQAGPQELAQVDGVGPSRAAALKAAAEWGRRLVLEQSEERPEIRNPTDAAMLLLGRMDPKPEQEEFWVILMDTRHRVLDAMCLYRGTLNQSQVRVGEVFREAVRRNVSALIVGHNHPSGDPSPSPEDVAVTRDLVAAGKLLGCEVVDHVVLGSVARWVSLRERGLGFEGA